MRIITSDIRQIWQEVENYSGEITQCPATRFFLTALEQHID